MLPGVEEEQFERSWELTELALISKDRHVLNTFQTLKYINIALLTVLIYDHCLTFNLERKRIWTLRWKLPKYLFMFNRYMLPPVFFFHGLSNSVKVGQKICNVRIFMPIPMAAAILTVELMLIVRVLALYGNSSGIARYLSFQLLVHWVIGGSFFAGFLLSKTRSIVGKDVFTGCLYETPNWGPLAWIPLLVAESILAILAIYKCRKYEEFSPTIKILARDSAIYFVSIFSIGIFNLCYSYKYKLFTMTLSLPTAVLTSIAASRLSMNIRAITVERGIATLTYSTLSKLSFNSRGSRGPAPNDTSAGAGGSYVDAVSSPTDIPSREEKEELDGGYYDDEDSDAWLEPDEDEEDEEIREEDRNMARSSGGIDVEKTIACNV